MTDASAPALGTCPRCGADGLEPGYLVDTNNGGRWDVQWSEGTARDTFLVGIERAREAREVAAMRCTGCGRLELFATTPMSPR